MVDAEELARLLLGSALGGRAVEAIDDERLLIRIGADEVWPAWQAARAIVARSGRWPVACTGWEQESPGFDLAELEYVPMTLAAARNITDPWDTWKESWRDMPLTEDWIPALVKSYDVSTAEARGFVEREAVLDDVVRVRFDRRLAEVDGDADRLEVTPYLTDRDKLWFAPVHEPAGIAFLSTADPVDAAAHVRYFGGDGAGLVAVVQDWHRRFGAELVAAWGTMLQFVSRRRPATLDDAWQLAGEQLHIAGNIDADRDDLALALMRTDAWFLHERP